MSCLHEFSLRMHTLVCKHASPASKLLCSQDMRIAGSARMCGRPAAAPYPGLRPSAAVPYPGVRPSKAGLRPYLIPASGLRPWERGLRFYLVNFYQIKKTRYRPKALILEIRLLNYTPSGGKLSVTEKIRDPLYTTR